jgi:alanine dehydrogenase
MHDLMATMEKALVEFSAGRVQQPVRTVLEVGDRKAFFGVMPAYQRTPPALGTKLVTVYGSNLDIGLPSHLATIVLLDPETGALLAIMDGRYITEARTAAVSAVSTRLLAREDADVLAIIGTGVQARSHIEALPLVRRFREIRVWSPNAERRRAFVQEMRAHSSIKITELPSAREAVAGARVVVTVTASREPVVDASWIEPGAHICGIGACRPDQRELDPRLVARARFFVDSRAGAMAEAGDFVMGVKEGVFGAEHIAGELGEVAANRIAGRQGDDQITIFKSLGMAVEDVAAAHLAYERAAARGLGRGVFV